MIKYNWRSMRVGQKRYISDEGNAIKNAMQTIYAWRKRGYDLKTERSSFGMVVTLLSVPTAPPTRALF